MKYGIITIDTPNSNRGNRLIEYALKTLLSLKSPFVSVPMFSIPTSKQISKLNTCDFVILPGSTILAAGPGQGEALAKLSSIKVPKFCVGASGWRPIRKYNLEALKYITPPIGVRDPDTLKVCRNLGLEAILVGCPTAYLPVQKAKAQIPFNIVGFARTETQWQIKILKSLPGRIIAATQEVGFSKKLIKQLNIESFTYDKPHIVMEYYAKTSAVYTGRLHGILPAMSQKKSVCFFGNGNDSRFTLLKHLNIKINPLKKTKMLNLISPEEYINELSVLKANFYKWFDLTIKRYQT